MKNKILGFKGFNKDLQCRDMQFEIGKEYKVKGEIKCCDNGIHFCINPFDVLDHYPLLDDNGDFNRFAKVEGGGSIDKEIDKGNNIRKVAVSNLKVIEEITLADFVNNGIEFIKEETINKMPDTNIKNDNGDNSAQIGSSGYSAQIGSSGDYAQIGSSGDYAKIGSSGDSAQINSTGKYAVICCAGNNSIAKGKKGSWITLSEWKYSKKEDKDIPVCVKTKKIDGVKIKEDTYYKLENGKFVEVEND